MNNDNKNSDTKVEFVDENGEKVSFNVIEETKINNVKYLLVTENSDPEIESGEDEEVAYILKDLSEDSSADAVYEMVEDDKELDYISKIFEELLDDDVELS